MMREVLRRLGFLVAGTSGTAVVTSLLLFLWQFSLFLEIRLYDWISEHATRTVAIPLWLVGGLIAMIFAPRRS